MACKPTKPATICYVELPAPDLDRAGAFYSSVFGWTVTPSDLGDKPYWMFSAGEDQLEGGLDPSRKVSGNGGVILYLKVHDIDEVLESVVAASGTILRSRFDIGGGYGYSAVIQDPNGNEIGLFCKK